MTLHEAIRLGAAKTPQCYGVLSDGVATCVIGAAYHGAGVPLEVMRQSETSAMQPEYLIPLPIAEALARTNTKRCPACQCIPGSIQGLILHLNDHHQWLREDIADLLEKRDTFLLTPEER